MSAFTTAQACQPRAFTLFDTCGGSTPACAVNDWQITTDRNTGRVTVKLDGGYSLEFNEARSEMVIIDPCGKRTLIWGDPHVDVNNVAGQYATDWNFFGTSSFLLKDGTKITINTVPWEGNRSMTLADNVVVTKGDKSLVVNGLSQNGYGTGVKDLSVIKGMNGQALDRAVWDGNFAAVEGDNGVWLDSRTNRPVTQADANASIQPAGTTPPPSACIDEQVKIASKCVQTYCFTWLEAMAAAFGNVLSKQIDKMNWIYQQLNACYSIAQDKPCSQADYDAYCAARTAMGAKGDPSGWTVKTNTDGTKTYTPTKEAADEAGKAQAYWQQVLTGAAQQFQLSSQTGMTVQNAISQGMQTVARAG